jgi:hypothetical protein
LLDPVRLRRRVPAPPGPAEAVFWTDGFGQPLLTRTGEGAHRRRRFFSRFDPDWNDLPRTTALAAWLRALFLPETVLPVFADPWRDLRRADPAQLPAASAAPGIVEMSLPLRRETPGLQGWCWLLAAILFGLERLLSQRRAPVAAVTGDPHLPQLAPQPVL